MKKQTRILLASFLILALLSACSPDGAAQAAKVTPAAGKAAIAGLVEKAGSFWSDRPLMVYAAPYYKNEAGGGFYMLDITLHPQVEMANDFSFAINDIAPGAYVLVVGPTPDDARLVVDENNQGRIFEVGAGQVLETGTLHLAQ